MSRVKNFKHSWEFLRLQVYKKVLGTYSRFMHPKTKLFALRFRCILEVLCVQDLQKKFWAQFHNLCVQKQSCVPWSTEVFWTLYTCKVYRKSFGRMVTIYISKNKVVCSEVQTYFGRCTPARFTEKVLNAILRFMRPKKKLFSVKFRHIWKVLALRGVWKCSGRNFTIYASKNKVVWRDNH